MRKERTTGTLLITLLAHKLILNNKLILLFPLYCTASIISAYNRFAIMIVILHCLDQQCLHVDNDIPNRYPFYFSFQLSKKILTIILFLLIITHST